MEKSYQELVPTCLDMNQELIDFFNLYPDMKDVNIFDKKNNLVQTLSQLQNSMTKLKIFQKTYVLHENGFRKVIKMSLSNFKGELAVKKICYLNKHTNLDIILKEVIIHSKLKHPLIIPLLDFFIDINDIEKYKIYIVTELGIETLYTIKNLSYDKILDYYLQILEAIEYCHNNSIIYGDLKPENIVLFNQDKIKLIDFGGASFIHEKEYYYGTFDYSSPKYISCLDMYNNIYKDLWSLGVLLYELCTQNTPFYSKCHTETRLKIMNIEYTMSDDIPLNFQQVIKGLLVRVPKDRLTIPQIREILLQK